jgi:hypothetical protein
MCTTPQVILFFVALFALLMAGLYFFWKWLWKDPS